MKRALELQQHFASPSLPRGLSFMDCPLVERDRGDSPRRTVPGDESGSVAVVLSTLLVVCAALWGAPCLGEDAGTVSPPAEHIRLRPNVSPTMAAAARELAHDIAQAMAASKLSKAVITGTQDIQWSAIVAFLRCFDESGIHVALSKPQDKVMSEFRRVYGEFLSKSDNATSIPVDPQDTCVILVERKGNPDHGTICAKTREPFSLDLKQRYENQPWVTEADELIDDRGAAFWPTEPKDTDRTTLCVGRSDPCTSLVDAGLEARARLAIAVRKAVFAHSEEWALFRELDVEPPGAGLWLPLRQPSDAFEQRFQRPYGTMYRVYHLARLTHDELSVLGRSARGEAFAHGWVPWFRAGGIIAVTILAAVAYQLARHRLRERWAVALRVMSVAAWLALVVAFAVVL